MLVGFARRNISPNSDTELAGFDLRKEKSQGVFDELYVYALALASDAGEKLLLLGFDLLGVPSFFCAKLKDVLSEELNLAPERIWPAATHTHAAPRDVFGRKESDSEYLQLLLTSALEAGRSAFANIENVRAEFGIAKVRDIASYRDLPRERSCCDMPLVRLKLTGRREQTELIRFQCHPTVLSEKNLLISKDLAGAWEKTPLAGSNVLMFNGACGDLSTRYTRQGEGETELERLRVLLAEEIVHVSTEPIADFGSSIRVSSAAVRLTNAKPLSDERKKKLISAHEKTLSELRDDAAKRELISIIAVLRREPKPATDERTIALSVADLGPVVLISLPFEINSGDGERIEKEIEAVIGKRAILLCYAGGYEGYLPSGRPIDENSSYQDVAASLAPEVRDEVFRSVIGLIKSNAEEDTDE